MTDETELKDSFRNGKSPFEAVRDSVDAAVRSGEELLARTWKIIAAEGLVWIAFGFVLVLWPDIGLTALVVLIGVLALVRGVFSGFAAFVQPLESSERRWLFLEAALGTAVGIVVLAWPDISAKALLYVVAAWAIALGILMFGSALMLPLSGARRFLGAAGGVVLASFGAVMFIDPAEGAVAQVALIAAFAIVGGVMQVAFALALRELVEDAKERLRRPSDSPATRETATEAVSAREPKRGADET